jgi:hypothetical protein
VEVEVVVGAAVVEVVVGSSTTTKPADAHKSSPNASS